MEAILTHSAQEFQPVKERRMRLVKFTTDDNPVFINPEHVVSVRKGMKDTQVQTLTGAYAVKEAPEVVVRLLGAEEVALDITPALAAPRSIDL
jgi:hypothetical protein